MKAEEIRDRSSFKLWLDAVPKVVRREVAVAMASRCALRVLPFVANRGKLTEKQHVTLTMDVVRLNVVAVAGGPAGGDLFAAYVDAAYVDAAYAAASYAAAYAAADAADAADAAAAAADADAAAQVWNSIRRDAQKIELAGFEAGSGIALHREKLWSSGDDEFENAWADFRALLKSKAWADKGWPIWLEWYEPIIKGDPAFNLPRATAEALERDIALGSRDGTFNEAFWKRKPHEINAEIAEWVAEARAAEVLKDAESVGAGLAWYATSIHYSLIISGEASDADVAALEATAFEHVRLKTRLAALSARADAISAKKGWEELKSVCDELSAAIDLPTRELHTRIHAIYDASLMLACLMDYNNKLVADRGGNEFRPLQADESKLLQQVVVTVAPWIGRFPSAKKKDDEAGQMFSRMSVASIASHVEFVRLAQGAGLISDQDRQMMQSLLEALLKFGNSLSAPAEKAQAHGQGTVRKLTFAMALVVSNVLSGAVGAVGGKLAEDVMSETQTYKSTKQFLIDHVLETERIASELPPHLRAAFETVMNQLKRDNVPQPPPEPLNADHPSRRRRVGRR